jgi:hypothetical protein
MFDPLDLVTKSLADPAVRGDLAQLDAAGEYSDIGDSYFWESRPAGIAYKAEGDPQTIHTVFFYAEGREGYEQYAGALPEGLRFGMDRTEVRKLLGPPDTSTATLDRYNRDAYDVAAEYDADGRVEMVLVTTT